MSFAPFFGIFPSLRAAWCVVRLHTDLRFLLRVFGEGA